MRSIAAKCGSTARYPDGEIIKDLVVINAMGESPQEVWDILSDPMDL
jgi:hypothetical protein